MKKLNVTLSGIAAAATVFVIIGSETVWPYNAALYIVAALIVLNALNDHFEWID